MQLSQFRLNDRVVIENRKDRVERFFRVPVAGLLMEAHASGCPEDLQHATGQLRRALDAEGWAA